MNPTIPQNAIYRVFTVPWIFNDGTYGFKDMPCWVIETPRTDYAEYTEKGTKPMTLKEELSKLYSESTVLKRKQFLDNLPDLLREKAKAGKESITIYQSSILSIDLYIADLKEWCIKNGLDSMCVVIWPLTSDPNITIYWG